MKDKTAKEIVKAIGKEVKASGNTCCNLSGGVCNALTEQEFIKYFSSNDCGTIRCPFFKPESELIRVGDKFLTDKEHSQWLKMTVRVRWLEKRLDALDRYCLGMEIDLSNDPAYYRGMRAGITYAVDYLSREIRKLKIIEDEQQK